MARYRFAWSNFPPQVLEKLAAGLGLHGDPAEALRRAYGARPKVGFVQEAWPVLLDTWLTVDVESRSQIAQELHARGLGKTDISLRSKQGQIDYLRSCRNATTLREVVLASFLLAGEAEVVAAPTARAVPAAVQEPPQPSRPERPRDGTTQANKLSLDDWVVATLEQAYGLTNLQRDEDGDVPIPRGSAVLFVRAQAEGSPFLEVFAPLVRDVRPTAEVYEAVNAINVQVPMAKALVSPDGGTILLTAHLLTETLSSREFLFAIDMVCSAADHFDTLLQKRFGGHTLLLDGDDEEFDV